MADDHLATAADLADLRDDLMRAGDERKGLRKKLLKAIGQATSPAPKLVRAGIRAAIPHEGGLEGEVQATSLITRRTYLDRSDPVLEVRLRNLHLDVYALNHGILRHPLFGNRKRWFTQIIDPGWFEESLEPLADHVDDAVSDAVDDIEKELAGEGEG